MNHNILVLYVLATRGTQYKSKLQPPALTYTCTLFICVFSLQIQCGGGKKKKKQKNPKNKLGVIIYQYYQECQIFSETRNAQLI